MDVQIPDKLYFKIGEVAELAGVKPHVLRYWESEFGNFRPGKSRSQQRKYTRKDIELVLKLKDLLHNQGFTIAGARKKLREESRRKPVANSSLAQAPKPASALSALTEPDDPNQMLLPLVSGLDSRLLNEIRSDLEALRNSLSKAPSGE
jgi:DNA-binding transcriptional MerR regulator